MEKLAKKTYGAEAPAAHDNVRAALQHAVEAVTGSAGAGQVPRSSTSPESCERIPGTAAGGKRRQRLEISDNQLADIAKLKSRCLSFGIRAKKSALLAAALDLLQNLPDTALESAILPHVTADQAIVNLKKRRR